MAEPRKKYKIRISADRTLGPLDWARVEALVLKGRIQGEEPTSIEPFTEWRAFVSYPELSELLLKKLELDRKAAPSSSQSSEAATQTLISSQPTITSVATEEEKEDTGSYGIPTLVDIRMPANQDPDHEKTIVHPLAPLESVEMGEDDGRTKVLTPESMNLVLEQYKTPTRPAGPVKKNIFGKAVREEEYVTESGKHRLLTPTTSALLALGLLAIAWFSQIQEKEEDPNNIFPRYHTFPYVEVNMPPPLGNAPNRALSADLVEKGSELVAKETPSAYMTAIKKYFYLAAGRDPQNYDARALLASSYMRLSELVPRDQRLFETIEKLLFPGRPSSHWTPEYVVARAEYYQLLNRYDQAQEIINGYLSRRTTPELLYQKARIAYERRDLDPALSTISKAIPPENVQKANPRHLLLYATLLEQKGQKDAASEALKRLITESPNYGPGLLYHADSLFRAGQTKQSRNVLKYLLNRPYLLDRVQLAEAFVVAAKVMEGLNLEKRALVFATAAEKMHFDREIVEDLVFRLKSKVPATKKAYTEIMNARQRERARQIDLAINHYVRALESNRRDPTAFLLLGNLYEERGEIYEAIDRYKKALFETSHKPIAAALKLARIYADRYQLEDSKAMLRIANDLKEKRDQVNFFKGILQIRSKRPDLADPLFQLALRGQSRFPPLYIEMGDIETEKRNQKLAEFYYSIALRYEPYSPKAMLGVALSRFHLDSPSRAVAFLKDKLATQPNSAAILTNLAIIYLRSGDQDAGKNYLQNAIRSDSRYAEAFRLLGDLTKDEGDRQVDNNAARRHSYRYALASYEMYSKLAPNDPEGYKATGDLYFDIRDLGAAAKNYYKVLELTPSYPDVRLRLAQISRNGGDATKAMTLLEEEIKINPRSDAALVEKGNVFMAKKEFEAATKAFTDAARLNEKNADALFGLGVVHHLQGSFDNALSLFARVIKLDPLKADVYWQMGLIYQKLGNKVKALQAFANYKGTIRDPQAIAKVDEKIRELSK